MGFARQIQRTQAMRAKKQARRAARKVRWPEKFEGAIMWCPLCYKELRRIPDGENLSPFEQRQIVDAHKLECRAKAIV